MPAPNTTPKPSAVNTRNVKLLPFFFKNARKAMRPTRIASTITVDATVSNDIASPFETWSRGSFD